MAKVYEFLATGFEDIEALTTVDVLRRAGHEVVTLSISDEREVVSAHGVTILADGLLADADLSDADLLLLPGGMPRCTRLWKLMPHAADTSVPSAQLPWYWPVPDCSTVAVPPAILALRTTSLP